MAKKTRFGEMPAVTPVSMSRVVRSSEQLGLRALVTDDTVKPDTPPEKLRLFVIADDRQPPDFAAIGLAPPATK